jgi:predicted dienelactone hydrolase
VAIPRFAAAFLPATSAACSPSSTSLPQATTSVPYVSDRSAVIETTAHRVSLPFSELGLHRVGKRKLAFEDTSRGNRQISVTLRYPALWPEGSGSGGFPAATDYDPDESDSPYPLILSSTKLAGLFVPYLVSHGYAWASVDGIDTYREMSEEMIDQPLDILFAFRQLASDPPDALRRLIDTEHAGVMGYSFDGYNALAKSGATIDPEFYLAQCADPKAAKATKLSAFSCAPARDWDGFSGHAGDAITSSEDGLWQPMTDDRIRAVMPMAGEGWWLFGPRGLDTVDRPVLILVATGDGLYPENARIFEHLGTPNKALISFVGPGHMMIYEDDAVAQTAHFAVAFFGHHLKGRQDLAHYYSAEFVAQYDDLAWGAYED